MRFTIEGLGTALPPRRVSQEEATAHALARCVDGERDERRLAALYRRSGVASRHSVLEDGAEERLFPLGPHGGEQSARTSERMRLYAAKALPLAAEAARKALREADADPATITHLVTVSCTGFAAPGLDVGLIHELGLPPAVTRTQVGFMGCHGLLNGLAVADAFARSAAGSRVLLSSTELCTLHFRNGSGADRVVANALFADGAGALVGSALAGATPGWSLIGSGSVVLPQTEEQMGWRIGDHGFEMELSAQVPETIERALASWISSWLDRFGIGIDDVKTWAIHPGGPRVLDACESSLGLSSGACRVSREVLRECGNMSSATVLFILERLFRDGAPPPCVLLAFGPGLVVEAALLGAQR